MNHCDFIMNTTHYRQLDITSPTKTINKTAPPELNFKKQLRMEKRARQAGGRSGTPTACLTSASGTASASPSSSAPTRSPLASTFAPR